MGLLEVFQPVYKLLPEVKAPEGHPPLKTKLIWTAIALIVFFVLGNIGVIGLEAGSAQQLELFQQILASDLGTLITIGIGPIVLSSIILQLMVGAKLINADLSNPVDRAKFTSMQKLLAIILCFFEAAAYTGFGVFPSLVQPSPGMFWIVLIQIAFGGIILLFLDEVVSKYGIGSGVGLFIAGGVAGSFFWQVFQPPLATPQGLIQGRLFDMINALLAGQMVVALPIIIALLFALIIFLVVIFAEGMHINIPITMGKRGTGGRFPVKFLYVSNMPVILAAALFANIQIWANIVNNAGIFTDILNGLAWATTPARIPNTNYSLVEGITLSFFDPAALPFGIVIGEIAHGLVYIILLTLLSIVFARFWVEMGNQGPAAVAQQLQRSGMSIPGFRRDPRIIRQILDRYIPPITILGGMFVGLLAGIADLTTGSLVSGMGILLTVGIIYRIYEEIAKEAVLGSGSMMAKLLGKG